MKKPVLYRQWDHYNVINPAKLLAFHSKRFYCDKCFWYFMIPLNHLCFNICKPFNLNDYVEVSREKHECADCFKICRLLSCFYQHKMSRRSKRIDLHHPVRNRFDVSVFKGSTNVWYIYPRFASRYPLCF